MSDAFNSSKDESQKEWRCYHCDEVFTSQVDAWHHFGGRQTSEPACQIKAPGEFALLEALRNAEDQLARYHSEDSDVIRAMHSMTADHAVALRREEEKGYARGLEDAKKHPESIGLRSAVETSVSPTEPGAAFAAKFGREPASASDAAWLNGYFAGRSVPETAAPPKYERCGKPWGECGPCEVERSQMKSNCNSSASTDDGAPPSRTHPTSSVECPKCRTQLAFEGDECGLCKEEEA